MKKFHLVSALIGTLLIRGVPGQAAPQISNAYPPPEDIRKPDLTIPGDSSKPIAKIAYNPNGRFLAVAGNDNTIVLYDARPVKQTCLAARSFFDVRGYSHFFAPVDQHDFGRGEFS